MKETKKGMRNERKLFDKENNVSITTGKYLPRDLTSVGDLEFIYT